MRADRLLRVLRRSLVTFFGLQIGFAVVLSLVDSYRRRNKKPKPFPVSAPRSVPVGNGDITTYTFGQHLYDDMLAAIEGLKSRSSSRPTSGRVTRSGSSSSPP